MSIDSFVTAVVSSVSTVSVLGFLGFIFRSWIAEKLKASIAHEYNLKIIELQREREIRLRSEVVAELMAQWIKKDNELNYYELNRLSFQAFLWLPKGLAERLSASLAHHTGSDDLRTLVKELRTYLNGNDDGFSSSHVIVFKQP